MQSSKKLRSSSGFKKIMTNMNLTKIDRVVDALIVDRGMDGSGFCLLCFTEFSVL